MNENAPDKTQFDITQKLASIDERTGRILDVLSHGVSGKALGKTLVSQGKKHEQTLQAQIRKTESQREISENKTGHENVVKLSDQVGQIKSAQYPSSRDIIDALLADVGATVTPPESPNNRTHRRTEVAKKSKETPVSRQTFAEKRQKDILEHIGEKQQAAIEASMGKTVEALKKGFREDGWASGKTKGDLQDAVGLGVGGPIYSVWNELSGILGDAADKLDGFASNFKPEKNEKTGRTARDQDEQGGFDQQTKAIETVRMAVEDGTRTQRESSRDIIDALLADSRKLLQASKEKPADSIKAFEKAKAVIASAKPQTAKTGKTAPKSIGGALAGGASSGILGWLSDTALGAGGAGLSGFLGGALAGGTGITGALKMGGSALLKGAGGAARILGKAALPMAAATTALDAIYGWNNDREITRTFGNGEIDSGKRVANAVASVMDMGGLTTAITKAIGVGFEKADAARKIYDLFKWFKSILPKDKDGNIVNLAPEDLTMPNVWDVGKKAVRRVLPDVPDATTLGVVSRKYESGKAGAGAISTGVGDAGEKSYGAYQLTSKGGSASQAAKFAASTQWASEFAGLVPGTPQFDAKWKEIAARNPQEFWDAQHQYIASTHYAPLVTKLSRSGIDLTQRGPAVQEALFSRAVQHGVGGAESMIQKALSGTAIDQMSDAEIIQAIYDESGKRSENGKLAYFSKNAPNIQEGVAKRLAKEKAELIAMSHGYATVRQPADSILQTQKPIGLPVQEIMPPEPQPDYQAQMAQAAERTALAFERMNSRPTAPQQSTKPGYNIPMEFDDALLTLMIYDRI